MVRRFQQLWRGSPLLRHPLHPGRSAVGAVVVGCVGVPVSVWSGVAAFGIMAKTNVLPPVYRDCQRLLLHTEQSVMRFSRYKNLLCTKPAVHVSAAVIRRE